MNSRKALQSLQQSAFDVVPESYLESIRARFKCPGCGCFISERHGKLAHKSLNDESALYCEYCIQDFNLIVDPEESER